ncbi:MAG: phospholipid transport system substrate-binding protein [Polyangiales bacterium]|jgi:phospholipid transport system substrate-binding protein
MLSLVDRPKDNAMTLPRRIAFLLAVTLASFQFSASAEAQPARAQAYLEAQHQRANRILGQSEGAERSSQLTTLLGNLLDFDTLSATALGQHWEAQSEEARSHFVNLLRQLVERSYQANLEGTLNFEVSYVNAETRGERVLVQTSARSRANRRAPPVTIDYTMRREGRNWRVVDVITDGQSLVEGYRSQFNRIISRDGWDALITRMEQRLNR